MSDRQTKRLLSPNLRENVTLLGKEIGVGVSYDIIFRELHYGGKDFVLYCINGFSDDNVLNRIMEYLSSSLTEETFHAEEVRKLLRSKIGYTDVDTIDDLDDAITTILIGTTVLIIDGETSAVSVDARDFPARSPEEPDLERVVRGSRDGFVETLAHNTVLTRRRVRDPRLRFKHVRVGRRSRTDVVVAYIEDIANPDLVDLMTSKLQEIEIDGLPMAEKTVEELMFGRVWNPYPLVRFTERPDVAAVHLFEGHVLVYVDTSPSVMIAPTTFFHHLQHAEEFRQKPIIGVYVRWLRMIAILASILLSPLWMAMMLHPAFLPHWLLFTKPDKVLSLPLFWQMFTAEVGLGLLRMAAVHTPDPLGAALGLVAALMIGDVAIDVGFFTKEAILFTAISAIGTFATPSYELALANQMVRTVLLILTGLFGFYGFIGGVVAWFLLLSLTKSLDTPYFWPLIPFQGQALVRVLFREPVKWNNQRPAFLKTQDRTRR